MSDLTEFLDARIGEDEAVAQAALPWDAEKVEHWIDGELPTREQERHLLRYDPARVLAECAAKRAAVAEFVDAVDGGNGEGYMAEQALRFMTLVYADHPDFREEWRP